ncbi:MAG: DUF2793 domain-containing protein [Erythrobacter sp.]
MTTFADFPATTRHHGLPFLFVGQSQKEFFVNQSLAMIDALLHRSINASLSSPPQEALDGDCYRITSPAQGDWAGREGALAMRIAGEWQFVAPVDGWLIYDRAARQYLHFDDSWNAATIAASPTGGAVIDVEARALLTQVIDALGKLGLVAVPSA